MKIGLVAGYGVLPIIFLKEVKCPVYVAGFKGYTSNKLKSYSEEFKLFPVGDLQSIIQYFKYTGVDSVIFLGYVPHKILTTEKYRFDFRAMKMFSKLANNTAMSIFNGLVTEFEKEKIKIDTVKTFLPHLFAEKGVITKSEISNDILENINFGYTIAKEIARLDIGLTVVVKNKVIVAVEALEGTDQCILRGKKLAGAECCIVKVARPNQDMRFDLPVIGPRTVEVLKLAKAKVIAVENEKTLIIEKEKVIKKLNSSGIILYGI